MILGTAMVIRFGNRLLGLKDYKGRGIILPGGKVEEGETYRQTAIRECKEEMGITVTEAKLVFHGFSTPKSYCYAYEAKQFRQYDWVIDKNFGSGKVGIFEIKDFMNSKYKAFYDALFEELGFIK